MAEAALLTGVHREGIPGLGSWPGLRQMVAHDTVSSGRASGVWGNSGRGECHGGSLPDALVCSERVTKRGGERSSGVGRSSSG